MNLHTAPESLFWDWIRERHTIFLKRQVGEPKPWTEDYAMRHYKFTNPFRENDRGTVWLRENFLEPHRSGPLEYLAGNICWYRMFNWWGTGKFLGWLEDWNPEIIADKLHWYANQGNQVFTGAHIVYSPPGRSKIDAIVDVCSCLWRLCQGQYGLGVESLAETALRTCSLEAVYDRLRTVYCVGGFMAYEMVTDMRHTPVLDYATDTMTWANLGPGAKRGLHRLCKDYAPDDVAVASMRDLLSRAPSLLRIPGREEFYPQFELRDIEHSLCEFDKYCRVIFEEGKPRSRFDGV